MPALLQGSANGWCQHQERQWLVSACKWQCSKACSKATYMLMLTQDSQPCQHQQYSFTNMGSKVTRAEQPFVFVQRFDIAVG